MLWKSKSGLFHSLSCVSATQASHTVQQSTLTELFVFPLQSSFTGPSGCADCHVPGSAAGHRTPGKSKPMESILKHIFLFFFWQTCFFSFSFWQIWCLSGRYQQLWSPFRQLYLSVGMTYTPSTCSPCCSVPRNTTVMLWTPLLWPSASTLTTSSKTYYAIPHTHMHTRTQQKMLVDWG